MDIASNLKIMRRNRGYRSARSFARKFDITFSTYAQHESGKRKLTIDNLVHYSKLLDTSLVEIIEISSDNTSKRDKINLSLMQKILSAAQKIYHFSHNDLEVMNFCLDIYNDLANLESSDPKIDEYIALSLKSFSDNISCETKREAKKNVG